MSEIYDVIIVGAGPGGCGLALYLSELNIRSVIIDKAVFPKRKVCGGAVSDRAINRLKELSEKLKVYDDFLKLLKKKDSYGVRVFTPKSKVLEFDFKAGKDKCDAPGYVCERSEFDNFMLDQVLNKTQTTVYTDTEVTGLEVLKDCVKVFAKGEVFEGKIVIGADGANSIVSRKLIGNISNKKQNIGISAHFNNVSGFHEHNLIDVYFLNEVLPGYFWIFKLPDNKANVGMFMPVSKAKKIKKPLMKLAEEIISGNSEISQRFKNSSKLDEFKGSILPVGQFNYCKNIKISGDRFILCGDAARLTNPITGEGIGNALLSSKLIYETLKRCFKKNDFSKEGLKIYDKLLNKKLKKEMILNSAVRRSVFSHARILELTFKLIKTFKRLNFRIARKLYKG